MRTVAPYLKAGGKLSGHNWLENFGAGVLTEFPLNSLVCCHKLGRPKGLPHLTNALLQSGAGFSLYSRAEGRRAQVLALSLVMASMSFT